MPVQTIPYKSARKLSDTYLTQIIGSPKHIKKPILLFPDSITNKRYLSWLWATRIIDEEFHNQRKSLINKFNITRGSTIFTHNLAEDWLKLLEKVDEKPVVKVSYINQDSIDDLLGEKGKIVLERIINLVKEEAMENEWPLTKIEVIKTEDLEFNEWEYVLVVLFFNTSFEVAENNLYSLYDKIDLLSNSFSEEEQEILQRKIYFDTRASLPTG